MRLMVRQHHERWSLHFRIMWVAGAEVASPTISTPAQPCARRAEGNGRELFGETTSETDANDDGKDAFDSGVQRANDSIQFFLVHQA